MHLLNTNMHIIPKNDTTFGNITIIHLSLGSSKAFQLNLYNIKLDNVVSGFFKIPKFILTPCSLVVKSILLFVCV
jgi:hypothetical protein